MRNAKASLSEKESLCELTVCAITGCTEPVSRLSRICGHHRMMLPLTMLLDLTSAVAAYALDHIDLATLRAKQDECITWIYNHRIRKPAGRVQ